MAIAWLFEQDWPLLLQDLPQLLRRGMKMACFGLVETAVGVTVGKTRVAVGSAGMVAAIAIGAVGATTKAIN